MKILIFGITGLIGSNLFFELSRSKDYSVFGAARVNDKNLFPANLHANILTNVDVGNLVGVQAIFDRVCPDIVINCVGVTKHIKDSQDPTLSIRLNSLLPHELHKLCKLNSARLIQISTDCVFAGLKGLYDEGSIPDSVDLYGRTKILGEIISDDALTLRISTVGSELQSKHGLLEWFLDQKLQCEGYSRAIFSGLPTKYFAGVLADKVFQNPDLVGLYHISSIPIDKYSLLNLFKGRFNVDIDIIQNDKFVIDRSLSCSKFCEATGYKPLNWDELVNYL